MNRKKHSRLLWSLGLSSLVLVIVGAILVNRRGESPAIHQAASATRTGSGTDSSPSESSPAFTIIEDATPRDVAGGDGRSLERKSQGSAFQIQILVRNQSSESVPDAVVSVESIRSPGTPPSTQVAASGVADEQGRALLDAPSRDDAALAVWASHSLHRSAVRRIEPGWLSNFDPIELALEPAPQLVVRVVDDQGNPIPGAEVEETAPSRELSLVLDGTREASGAGISEELLTTYRRSFTTDEVGSVRAHPCSFPLVFRARSGDRLSRPVLVESHEREVELRVLPSAQALGTVHLPAGVSDLASVRVRCSVCPLDLLADTHARVIATSPVAADGTWGPVDLPLEQGSLLFRVEGGALIPAEKEIDPRTATPPYVVDFSPELGQTVPAFVFTREEAGPRGIAGARVEFRWTDESSGRIRAVSAWTTEDGRAELNGCALTTGSVLASAPGHAGAAVHNVGLPISAPVEIELEGGGVVEGRCVHRGEGVSDFDVALWSGLARDHILHAFRDRPDGSFRIESAPLGAVHLSVSSPSLPESEVRSIEVSIDEPTQILVELPAAELGRGRIVDAATGEPVSDAHLQPIATVAFAVIGLRGRSYPVRSDGSFEVAAFPAKDCHLQVEADGYARVQVSGAYSPEHGVDFGEIALAPSQDLHVRLVSKAPFDAHALWFAGQGHASIPFRRFPPSGELVIPDIAPGEYVLSVAWPSGDTLSSVFQLVAGRPWVAEFEIDPAQRLVVEVVPQEGGELPEAAVFATYLGAEENVSRGNTLPPDGVIEFAYFPARDAWITLTRPDQRVLATAQAPFTPGEERRVTVQLTDRTLVLRVVDADGKPLPESQVDVATPGERGWTMYCDVDAEGRAIFPSLSFDTVVAHVYHPSAGDRSNLVIPLAPAGTTKVEVALTGGEDLQVRLVDAGEPLPGAHMRLHPATRSIVVGDRQTDSEGIATWSRLSVGSYQAHVDHAGVWPSWHSFEFQGTGEPITLPVRSLGNLHLALRNADGTPIPGAAVDLTSVELSERVADWAAQHRIAAKPADFRTNAAGELRVTGIPRGPYDLAVSLPSGEVLRQRVDVPRKRTLVHELRAP